MVEFNFTQLVSQEFIDGDVDRTKVLLYGRGFLSQESNDEIVIQRVIDEPCNMIFFENIVYENFSDVYSSHNDVGVSKSLNLYDYTGDVLARYPDGRKENLRSNVTFTKNPLQRLLDVDLSKVEDKSIKTIILFSCYNIAKKIYDTSNIIEFFRNDFEKFSEKLIKNGFDKDNLEIILSSDYEVGKVEWYFNKSVKDCMISNLDCIQWKVVLPRFKRPIAVDNKYYYENIIIERYAGRKIVPEKKLLETNLKINPYGKHFFTFVRYVDSVQTNEESPSLDKSGNHTFSFCKSITENEPKIIARKDGTLLKFVSLENQVFEFLIGIDVDPSNLFVDGNEKTNIIDGDDYWNFDIRNTGLRLSWNHHPDMAKNFYKKFAPNLFAPCEDKYRDNNDDDKVIGYDEIMKHSIFGFSCEGKDSAGSIFIKHGSFDRMKCDKCFSIKLDNFMDGVSDENKGNNWLYSIMKIIIDNIYWSDVFTWEKDKKIRFFKENPVSVIQISMSDYFSNMFDSKGKLKHIDLYSKREGEFYSFLIDCLDTLRRKNNTSFIDLSKQSSIDMNNLNDSNVPSYFQGYPITSPKGIISRREVSWVNTSPKPILRSEVSAIGSEI